MKFRSCWLISLAAFTLLLTAGLLSAPATLMGRLVEHLGRDQVRLTHTEGGFWRGQGTLFLRQSRKAQWLHLGTLGWQPHWQGLFHPGLRLHLNQGHLDLDLSTTGLEVHLHKLRLPAGALLPYLHSALPSEGWGGWIEVNRGYLRGDLEGLYQGDGELRWQQAESSALANRALGNYLLGWQLGLEQGIDLELQTERGPLVLTAQAHVGTDGKGKVIGSAHQEGREQAALSSLLEKLGRPDPDRVGGYLINTGFRWKY